MGKELYGTPEMVKQFRKCRRQKNGEMPDFMETLELMEQEGALSEEPIPRPFLDGHMSKEAFMEAYDRIPFRADLILEAGRVKERKKTEGAMFRNGKDVACVQHIHDYGFHRQPVANFFAVTYLYQGKVRCVFDGQTKDLKAGDLLIVTPRFLHETHTYSGSFAFEALIDEASFNIVFNDFLAVPSRMSDFFSNALNSETGNYCIIRGAEDDSELRFYLQSFANECAAEEVYSNSCAVSLMKLFLSRAFRKYGQNMELFREDFHKRKVDAESIRRYISNHYVSVTLEQTADHFHYNSAYLSRYIRNHFKKSFMEIVTELKIDHAREYLKNTDKHIMDIALLVGYDSADHFSRMFRKYTGMSPAAFRKENRQIRAGRTAAEERKTSS